MVGPPPASWAVRPEAARGAEVAPGVWRLRLPLPWTHTPHVNAFALARDDGGITLVDCGTAGDPSCWDALVAALLEAGFSVGDVRLLVLTHYHSDHAGQAARLVEETGCEVAGHPAHAHFTDATLRPWEIAAARERRARLEGVPEHELSTYCTVREEVEGVLAAVLPDRALRDGDTVASAAGPWEVLETPGHAPSHLCLHQRDTSVLITGDLLAPAFHPYFDYGYTPDPVAETRGSLRRVSELGPLEHVLPGHGRPIADLAGALATWEHGLDDAVASVAAALRDVPAGAYETMVRVFGAQEDPELATWVLAQVLGYLRHLRLRDEIERTVAPDGRFRYAVRAESAMRS
jgi:glyoxylase-like metal-dependent hydrolase (beta-lactamase superfamily II)